MKKVLLMLVAGAFISMGTMSCKKCGTCAAIANVKFCDGDAGYDAAKASCELAGQDFK